MQRVAALAWFKEYKTSELLTNSVKKSSLPNRPNCPLGDEKMRPEKKSYLSPRNDYIYSEFVQNNMTYHGIPSGTFFMIDMVHTK